MLIKVGLIIWVLYLLLNSGLVNKSRLKIQSILTDFKISDQLKKAKETSSSTIDLQDLNLPFDIRVEESPKQIIKIPSWCKTAFNLSTISWNWAKKQKNDPTGLKDQLEHSIQKIIKELEKSNIKTDSEFEIDIDDLNDLFNSF